MLNVKDVFSRKKKVVGLDIGSSSLKLAEIVDTAKGPQLTYFSSVPLDRGVVADGVLVEPEMVTAKLKDLFKAFGSRKKGIVTSLSGNSVIQKKVTFASMEEDELRELIRDEAGKYLPFDDMDDVNFDFQILGENEFNPNQMDVLLVAAKKDIIHAYTDAIQAAGLDVAIMDVDSFALETMYETNYEIGEHELVVIVNIGASITNINVLKDGVSTFTRDFTLGGNSITEAIQSSLGVTFEQAEDIKVSGLAGEDEAIRNIRDNLMVFADPICMEIERSVDYFRSTYSGENIKRILLSGGGAKLPGIAADLAQRLNIETAIVNPFNNIEIVKKVQDQIDIESVGPIAAVAVGLALRRLGDK
ncbi:MAG: type IV pilus assembly protein PilM [Deltaproteobacteria bacterium]|nr:type IV pilus assembly protein PilM [Deltaproteobacteria bacterium]